MVAYLESLGCTNVEQCVLFYSFEFGGYTYSIADNLFDETMTLDEILRDADLMSCCGDAVDRDIMVCPSCGEHI